jgi:hypothetical protein
MRCTIVLNFLKLLFSPISLYMFRARWLPSSGFFYIFCIHSIVLPCASELNVCSRYIHHYCEVNDYNGNTIYAEAHGDQKLLMQKK